MAELQVFHDGSDWVIAESAAEAAAIVTEQRGEPVAGEAEFVALRSGEFVGVLCNEQGKPDDYGVGINKTCAEWIKQEGKGILCSKDF